MHTNKVKTQYWMPVIFATSGSTALKTGRILSQITARAQEDFQKSLSVNTVPYGIHKSRLKLNHSNKKKAICEHDPETQLLSLGQGSFIIAETKWKLFASQIS